MHVRKHLEEQGLGRRGAQDDAIQDARHKGMVTGSALEGRHGVTQAEREAQHGEGDERIGFLSLRPQKFAEHDVSGEKRDESGKWTAGRGGKSNDAHESPTKSKPMAFKVKPPKKLYRGVMNSGQGAGTYSLGKGLYSTPSKSFLKAYKYDKIIELSPEAAFPRNPLVLRNADGFADWLLRESGIKNMREFNAKYKDPGEFVREKGHDGVWAGDEVVRYDSPQQFSEGYSPQPGERVFWVSLNGKVHVGTFDEMDNGTAILTRDDGSEEATPADGLRPFSERAIQETAAELLHRFAEMKS